MKKKKDICKERGYHKWDKDFNSTNESYYDIDFEVTCEDCNAVAEASGSWYDLPEDREEEDE